MKPRMYQDETGNCYTKQNRHDGNVSRPAYTVLKSSSECAPGTLLRTRRFLSRSRLLAVVHRPVRKPIAPKSSATGNSNQMYFCRLRLSNVDITPPLLIPVVSRRCRCATVFFDFSARSATVPYYSGGIPNIHLLLCVSMRTRRQNSEPKLCKVASTSWPRRLDI